MSLGIVVDIDSMMVGAHGSVTGTIYWRAGDVAFPQAGWNDFVLALLAGWLQAIVRLEIENSESEELHFMEGPFTVELAAIGPDMRARCIQRRRDDARVIHEFMLSKQEVLQTILIAATSVIRYCTEHDLENRDVEDMRKYRDMLCRAR